MEDNELTFLDWDDESEDELNNDSYLVHYGVARRSGRYPWGSGKDPYQHSGSFLSRCDELKKAGIPENEMHKYFTYVDKDGTVDHMTMKEFRTHKAWAKDEERLVLMNKAVALRDKGYTLNEIADKMGYKNDSSVRSLLNEQAAFNTRQAKIISEQLKERVDQVNFVDVGKGVETELNISPERMQEALHYLELEGYHIYRGRIPQVTNPTQKTTLTVLASPDKKHKEIFEPGVVKSLKDYTLDTIDIDETSRQGFVYPESMDLNRLKIRYAEDGGLDKDGLIEIRRGVDDLSLGNSLYSQVRILVDNDRYLKGMAIYSNGKDMPDGVDVIFNTNKTKDKAPRDVLKAIKDDPDNPFGSAIKENGGQSWYIGKDGKKHLSLINKRADEGDWNEWKNKVPSQFLAKQSKELARQQLNLAIDSKRMEYEDILSCENPTVKKNMLKTFSEDCDSAAVHLYAAALPRQRYQVIIPITTMKDNEVYAPNYRDGEKVALIRYPHGGTFEIPILTVNNKQKTAKEWIQNGMDAIGINSNVAGRLSGADFDGDTVMVIPTRGNGYNKNINIKSTPPLKGLEGFEPKLAYPERKGMRIMNNTQNEMGRISNLITDMTLKGATEDELARAVRHSMVVIDAEKHRLDYQKSEIDNDIASLKKKYQGHIDPSDGKYHEGSSTIISKAKSEDTVLKRQGTPKINIKGKPYYDSSRPEGALLYKTLKDEDLYYQERWADDKTTGRTTHKKGDLKYNKDGSPKIKARTQKSTKMLETDDAYSLMSDGKYPMEIIYADYANTMKALANQARKEMATTKHIKYDSDAYSKYKPEVDSLQAKLNMAKKNKPRERQAQELANAVVESKKKSNPNMSKADIKKESARALAKARLQVGAQRTPIDITPREWEAIQKGAISETKLKPILDNTDSDLIKQYAMPKTYNTLSDAKISKAKAMASNGYTTAQIADQLGVSTSTIHNYIHKGEQ